MGAQYIVDSWSKSVISSAAHGAGREIRSSVLRTEEE